MNKLLIFSFVVLLSSCAGTYKTISPPYLTYPSKNEVSGIKYSYRFDVLDDTGNKKYAKKESKKGLKLIALEIENTTDQTINFRRDIDIYMGDRLIVPVEPEIIKSTIKQPAPLYLLWGLLWVIITNCDGDDCNSTPIPLGLGIGLVNVAIAGNANTNFMNELNQYNLLERNIAPGEKAYGLVGLSTEISAPIELKLKKYE